MTERKREGTEQRSKPSREAKLASGTPNSSAVKLRQKPTSQGSGSRVLIIPRPSSTEEIDAKYLRYPSFVKHH